MGKQIMINSFICVDNAALNLFDGIGLATAFKKNIMSGLTIQRHIFGARTKSISSTTAA